MSDMIAIGMHARSRTSSALCLSLSLSLSLYVALSLAIRALALAVVPLCMLVLGVGAHGNVAMVFDAALSVMSPCQLTTSLALSLLCVCVRVVRL